MAVKASDQISIVDVTDAYSVSMTSEAYTFVGDTTAALAGSCSTQITAMCGSENVLVTVGTITTPSGITAAISNNGSTAVTVTFTAAASTVKTACEATIPLTIDGDKTFTKKFSFGVALKGTTGATGAKGDKGDQGDKGDKGDKGDTGAKGDKGDTGAAGADAITISISSSNGFIFKNADIVTVLTAHVFKAGKELNSTEIAALGTVKWYKDGSTTAAATGVTYTISAGDVSNKATFSAQLAG